ncbi:MAG: hypothetical protein U9N81_00545 [Bacillota bacterium]|nr:hypothetical protein [Bacillota bacterium]
MGRKLSMYLQKIKDINHPYGDRVWDKYENSFPVYERRRIEDQIEAMNCKAIVEGQADKSYSLIFS